MASEQPQVVEAKPTLKEQVSCLVHLPRFLYNNAALKIMGQAMAINGALTGRKEKTAAGEALYTGTQGKQKGHECDGMLT